MPSLFLIAAMSQNRVIGKGNQLPWHLPADLLHFKKLTSHHTIIMGRKTFESIGKALPNRQNIVISSQHFLQDDIEIAHSIPEAIALARHDIFIIGGAHIYQQTLSLVEKMYVTLVDAVIEGDRFFPEWDASAWTKVAETYHHADDKNQYSYRFLEYEKNISEAQTL